MAVNDAKNKRHLTELTSRGRFDRGFKELNVIHYSCMYVHSMFASKRVRISFAQWNR